MMSSFMNLHMCNSKKHKGYVAMPHLNHMKSHLPAFMPACLHACLHACLLACLLACMFACMSACLPACLPACILWPNFLNITGCVSERLKVSANTSNELSV